MGDPIGVVAKERLPTLRSGPPLPCHIFGDRGLTNVDAELEEFAVDPGSAPQRAPPWVCRREVVSSIARTNGGDLYGRPVRASRLPNRGRRPMSEEILIGIPNKKPRRHRVTKAGLIERRVALLDIVRDAQPATVCGKYFIWPPFVAS